MSVIPVPRTIECLKNYNLKTFTSDLVSGLTVGLVALPLAMAFAISSGVPPQAGIYTAIIAGFLISALGGSRCQIGGPTGAFVVIVSGIVALHGMDGLFTCTLMAGILLMILGLTGLGTAVKFIPRPVVIGFTNGIAVLIASTQIKDFFGLTVSPVPGDFAGRMEVLARNWSTFSPTATITGALSLALIILMVRFAKKVPGAIVALFVGTLVVWLLKLPLETIETRFHGIPSGLPRFAIPHIQFNHIHDLIQPAITVTILGAVESLLSAVVADQMAGDRHDSNTELFAQGVANFFSPFFGGLPATGAIARTATNIRSGAKTPVSGMIHALVLLLILLVAAPLAKHIPLCILASILFMVSYNMGEWRAIPEILKLSKADISVWFITFALTVFADLSVAVEAGMILAALLYIGKVTSTTTVTAITPEYVKAGRRHSLQAHKLPDGVAAYRIHGPFLFGATDKLTFIEDQIDTLPNVVLLRLRNMTVTDATGIHALQHLAEKLSNSGRTLVMCGVREQPLNLLRKSGLDEKIGPENLCPTLEAAIARAETLLKEYEMIEAPEEAFAI